MLNQFESGQFLNFYERFVEKTKNSMKYSELYKSVKEAAANVQVQQIELIYFRNLILYLIAIYSFIFLLFLLHVGWYFRNKKFKLVFSRYTVDLKITFSFKVPLPVWANHSIVAIISHKTLSSWDRIQCKLNSFGIAPYLTIKNFFQSCYRL